MTNRMRPHRTFLFLPLLLLLVLTACEKDPDQPPANMPDDVMTLSELRDMYNGQPIHFDDDISIYATVTMDESSGNIYREAYVQDATAAINLQMDFAGEVSEDDSVRISLKGSTLSTFENMLQLDSVLYGDNYIRLGEGTPVTPQVVDIEEILDGGYQAELVKLEGVQFVATELGNTFADAENQFSENRTLQDCDNNQIIVRTSGYADFAGEELPTGNGTLIGIVSRFRNDWQLLIRRMEEADMEGERCETDAPEGEGTFEDPYNVAYAIANNTGNNMWVEGTIVGVMETDVDPFTASFEPPFDTPTNLIIADDPDETSLSNVLIVQLPFGDIRDDLNLVDNQELHGVTTKLLGDLEFYFGQPGMLNTAGYWIDGDGIVPTVGFWEATFSNEADGIDPFTDHNLSGDQSWERQDWDNGSAVMSGFANNQANENENWMVSPAIDLADRSGVSLEIREAINYITSYDDLQLLIASDYEEGSDPSESGDWIHFDGFNRPPGDNWNFMYSGQIDISQFDGESVHIAFRYTSSDTGAATWQISEVNLYEEE